MRLKRTICCFLCSVALAVSALGCSMRTSDLTMIGTKDATIAKSDLDALPKKKVVGKDSAFLLLFIPFGIPTLENAVDDALAQGGGNLMLDAKVYETGWFVPFGVIKCGLPVGLWTVEARGDVVKTGEVAK